MLETYPDVLTLNETIEILGVSRNMLYDLIHTGTLPAYRLCRKIWRVNKPDLILYLKNN